MNIMNITYRGNNTNFVTTFKKWKGLYSSNTSVLHGK
jgi:hypothetical protein